MASRREITDADLATCLNENTVELIQAMKVGFTTQQLKTRTGLSYQLIRGTFSAWDQAVGIAKYKKNTNGRMAWFLDFLGLLEKYLDLVNDFYLLQQAARGRANKAWIDIKEQRPEDGQVVLILIRTEYKYAPTRLDITIGQYKWGEFGSSRYPTHWMPLPELPEP